MDQKYPEIGNPEKRRSETGYTETAHLETANSETAHSETADSKTGHSEIGRSETVHSKKRKCEETTTSRQESVSISIENLSKYQKKYCEKPKIIPKWKKKATKLDKNKKSNFLFRRSYFVFAVDEGDTLDYEPETRNGFVAKVFLIVFVMLFLNGLVAFIVRFWPFMIELIADNVIVVAVMLFIALAILIIIHIGMAYFTYMQTPPCTWVNLTLACICYTLILSLTTLIFNTVLIFVAIAATALVVFMCFLIALTKLDFTKCYAVAVVLVVAAIASSLFIVVLKAFGVYMKPLHMASLVFGILVSSFVLIMQMQMILGGKTVEISEDDLALPAFLVYTSIIGIFLQMLKLLQLTDLFEDSELF